MSKKRSILTVILIILAALLLLADRAAAQNFEGLALTPPMGIDYLKCDFITPQSDETLS